MTSIRLSHQEVNVPKPFSFTNNQFIIPPKTYLKETIHISISDEVIAPIEIIIGDLSEVKLIIDLMSHEISEKSFSLHLVCGRGSIVKFVSIINSHSKQGRVFQRASVKKDAQLKFFSSLVSDQMKANLSMDLLEEGASVNLSSLTISAKDQNQTIDATITHYAPNTYGDMTNIGIVNDRGQIVLNGIGKIEKGMKNANAFQNLKGIILSDLAICEVNPVLIIDEFDVKAGHGATVGKIEENQLYYLMSRGLSQKQAERLIIGGFIKPIIDEIDDEELKERFTNITNERI
jgi:Fe-S cluster assembly protein SufD